MAKKQYPEQSGPYLVKVKSNQSTDAWQNFDTARLQISVGQEYHEGDKLRALTNWCRARFNKVVFCVNDSLQHYNLMFEKSLEEDAALSEALSMGDEWLRRNMPVIKGVENVKIVRWDEWKARPAYPKGFLQVEWLYTNNMEFKAEIDRNIDAIWKRRTSLEPHLYPAHKFSDFFKLSKRYLLEEMAAFSLMYETETAIDIYPGTTLFAATAFKGKEVENAPAGLNKGHFCRVDFARNKRFDTFDFE